MLRLCTDAFIADFLQIKKPVFQNGRVAAALKKRLWNVGEHRARRRWSERISGKQINSLARSAPMGWPGLRGAKQGAGGVDSREKPSICQQVTGKIYAFYASQNANKCMSRAKKTPRRGAWGDAVAVQAMVTAMKASKNIMMAPARGTT